MKPLTNTQYKKLMHKSFEVVQFVFGLGIPIKFGMFLFSTYPKQKAVKRFRESKGQYCFQAKYDIELLKKAKMLSKGGNKKISVGKFDISPEELDNMI